MCVCVSIWKRCTKSAGVSQLQGKRPWQQPSAQTGGEALHFESREKTSVAGKTQDSRHPGKKP